MTEPADRLNRALAPIVEIVKATDPADPEATASLRARLPLDSAPLRELGELVRDGVTAGWLAPRERAGLRFGRVREARDESDLSIDCVRMSQPGPGHSHPNGEFDLSFSVEGDPTFDAAPPGWMVYPPGSWHVPTVAGGVMDILYFLPGGAIRFEPRPEPES